MSDTSADNGSDPRLQALLRPRSIALVGASDDPSRPPGRPLRYLRRDGYAGTVYAVNPRRKTVQGEPAYASLGDLPEVPDHVFVLTGSDTVVDIIHQCGRLGVPAATILSDGFADAGADGATRLTALRAAAANGGVRLLGPNSIGLVDTRSGLTLTANAAFVDGDLPTGGTFVVSQSGSLIGALVSRGKARGIGFAGVVSVGGECDITIGELCSASLGDPDIDGYALFLENLGHAEDLKRFAARAHEIGRPVLVYKLGRSDAGADLTVTHTGALAGDDAVASAFFADLGFARVHTLEGLIEGTVLAPRVPARTTQGPARVGVVTATGGGAAMVVDQLGLRGIETEAPSAETLARLVAAAGFDISPARIVDLTLRGTATPIMAAALDILRTCGEYDLVIQILGSSAASNPDTATEPARTAPTGGVPLAVFVVPEAPAALATLASARLAAFRTPEACADAIAALLDRRAPRPIPTTAPALSGAARTLDEAAGYDLLRQMGVNCAQAVVVPVAGADLTVPFDYPVVAKAVLEGLAHKSDIGGVILDIADPQALTEAISRLATITGAASVLIQPQLPAIAEALVGFRRDPSVGPIVVLSAGGVLAELAGQPSIRLAPIDATTGRDMIAEVPSLAALLRGYRGGEPGDTDALATTLANLSQLALRPEIAEAEINPVLVTPTAAIAVDALVSVWSPDP